MNEFLKAWREHAESAQKFNRAGMTLIEIMIVITLMAALMTVIGYNVIGTADRGYVKMADMDLNTFKGACNQYRTFYKKYPNNLDELIHTPDNNPVLDTDEIKADPWGNEYIFEKNGNKIKIYSMGPDSLENTEDDIVVNF